MNRRKTAAWLLFLACVASGIWLTRALAEVESSRRKDGTSRLLAQQPTPADDAPTDDTSADDASTDDAPADDARDNSAADEGDAGAKPRGGSRDAPSAARGPTNELRAYAPKDGKLAEVAERLRERYGRAGLRAAVDEKSGRLLIFAPPTVHERLSKEMGEGLTPKQMAEAGANVPDGEQTPGERSYLARRTWDELLPELRRIWGARLRETVTEPGTSVSTWMVTLGEERQLQLRVDEKEGEIRLTGPDALIQRALRLLDILDNPAGAGMRVAPHRFADPKGIEFAIDQVRRPDDADVPREEAQPNVAARKLPPGIPQGQRRGPAVRVAQNPRDDRNPRNDGAKTGEDEAAGDAQGEPPRDRLTRFAQPAAQPGAGQPGGAQPPAGGEGDGADGRIGDVRIEFLDGLDAIIVTGDDRDVERVMKLIEDIERLSAETQPVMEVVQLEHVASDSLATIVTQIYDQNLAPRQGRVSVTALVKPNALLLVGRADNVDLVVDLITRLDKPVAPTAQFRVFLLKHAPINSVLTVVQEFYANRTALGAKAVMTGDFRTNSLIVHASPRDLEEITQLVRRLDVPESKAVNELRVFRLENTLATDLVNILNQSITTGDGAAARPTTPGQFPGQQQPGAAGGAGANRGSSSASTRSNSLRFVTIDAEGQRKLSSGILTEVQFTADTKANAILVSAPAEAMELIDALIRELDQAPAAIAQIKVFTIVNGDAQRLAEMLFSLFGQARQQGAGGQGAGQGGFQQGQLTVPGGESIVDLRLSIDQRTNSIIASGAANDLNVVEAILLRLDESDARQRKSVVYRLKNAFSVDVANAINQFLRSERDVQQLRELSPFEQIEQEVVVVPVQNGNSLIVSTTPRFFDEVRRIVEELDSRPPMVVIQVLIAEVSLNNTDEFGVELGLQDSVLFDRGLLGDLITTTQSTTFGNPPTTVQNQQIQAASLTPGYNFNNVPLGNSGSDRSLSTRERLAGQSLTHFSVGRVNGDLGFGGLVLSASSENVSILIRALREARKLEVLSRPQVTTLDNQPAFVQVGARVPRVRGVQINETGQVNQVQDEPVGLILGVTPRVSPDGLVVMEIDAEKSAVGPEEEGIPISISATGEVVRQPQINTTLAQTTVSALDGQTLVLGGLITKTRQVVSRRVPLLSEIPILGHLFRYDNIGTARTELLIIMTPHIIYNENDAELIKQIEASRMSWCLCDVEEIHGDIGPVSRKQDWTDGEVQTVYPDRNPTGQLVAPSMPLLREGEAMPVEVAPAVEESSPGPYFPGSQPAPRAAPPSSQPAEDGAAPEDNDGAASGGRFRFRGATGRAGFSPPPAQFPEIEDEPEAVGDGPQLTLRRPAAGDGSAPRPTTVRSTSSSSRSAEGDRR